MASPPCSFTPMFVSAIAAIIAGHLAQREIGRAQGQLAGKNLALAGMVMGYIGLGLALLGFLISLIYSIIQGEQPVL